MLIDRFLPDHDVREYHHVEVATDPDRAYRALWEADLLASAVVRGLFALRGLPWRRRLALADLPDLGFVLLGEETGREVVVGITGRFWRLRGDLRPVGPEEFAAYSDPRAAKTVWNFRVQPAAGGHSVVSTETRVAAGVDARRPFRRYWRLIGPFSALIRRRMLHRIRRQAERRQG